MVVHDMIIHINKKSGLECVSYADTFGYSDIHRGKGRT